MNIVDILFGRPLATEEEKAERIGPLKGIPIFGLDALSSAAYGPEAALTLLIPLGMAGAAYVWPITIGIVVLLGIVYFSYRESHWYHYLLHNNRPEAIRALLLFNGNQRITVVSIPYHLRA